MVSNAYRGLSQGELEKQYDARGSVEDFPNEMASYRALSELSYTNCAVLRDLSYGSGIDEKIDFFPADKTDSPIFIFLHGGYWRFLGRADSAFMAENFIRHGLSVAIVEYTLAPVASLDQIVDQVRRAVAYLYRESATLGVNTAKFFVGGSSAGAQLGAMVLATDWKANYGIVADPIRGALLVSGLYDLEPVSKCVPNTWLKLDDEAVARNSPVQHIPTVNLDILIAWGGLETEEFKRQGQEYASLLQDAGYTPRIMQINDRNHFDVIVDLNNPTRDLFCEFFQMVSAS